MLKLNKTWYCTAVIFLLILIPTQTLLSLRNKSLHGDEAYHITSGYSKLKKLDYRLFPEQGPLIPMISAFPLLFMNVSFPFDHDSWNIKNMNVLMPLFFFEYNEPYKIMFWSRIPMIFLSMILGFYVYKWARELYGKKSGLIALLIYAFSPNMLAHSRISSSDFGLTVFVFISVYYYWKFYKNPNTNTIIFAGFFLGLAQLTKFSAIFLFPIFGLIGLFMLNRRKISLFKIKWNLNNFLNFCLSLLTIFFISYLVIISAYCFQGMFKTIGKSLEQDVHLNKTLFPIENLSSNPAINLIIHKIPSPVPYYYARGLGFSFYFADKPSTSFIVGNEAKAVPYFFFVAFLVKTPIPLLLLLLISLFLCKRYFRDDLFLIIPFVLFHLAFSFTKKQFGYRYVIQTLPFLYVFVSKAVKKWKVLVSLLCIFYIISSVFVFPHYLSYFNKFAGNKPYTKFIGSNIDWGQDLFYLKDYLDENQIEDIKLSYYGFPITVGYRMPYNISYTPLECGPTSGLIAISVTKLMKYQDCYGWLLDYEPVDKIARTILVYNIKTQ